MTLPRLFGALGEDGIEVERDEDDLVVELFLAGGFEVLLTSPCGPFRL